MRDETQEAVDYISITRLHSAYADVVNRRAWEEFQDLFLPDAPMRVDMVSKPAFDLTGPAELGAFIDGAIERYSFFEFVVLNARVDLTGTDAEEARARVFMCELRQDRDTGEMNPHPLCRNAGKWIRATDEESSENCRELSTYTNGSVQARKARCAVSPTRQQGPLADASG